MGNQSSPNMSIHVQKYLHVREAFVYACLYMYRKLVFGEKNVQIMVDHIFKKERSHSHSLMLSVNSH